MYGRKSSRLIGALLFFLSGIYRLLIRVRTILYGAGFLKIKKLPIPVVSVGNITLGGTGKTPAVMAISGFFLSHGKKPVVLSRGYGRRQGPSVVTVSDGTRILAGAEVSGDEPALMAEQMKGVPVVVGKDRYEAGLSACSQFRPDIAVLDDGFQHIRLHRDLNILLIDGLQPFGTGKIFPAGILREPISSLQRADVIILTRTESAPDLPRLRERIHGITSAPVLTSRHVPTELIVLADRSIRPLSSLQGLPVLAFCGIAKPEAFVSLLNGLGADIRGTEVYPDHHRYTADDADRLKETAAAVGAAMIITTEKDGVKIRGWDLAGIAALRIRLEILEKDAWERVLLQRL